jgi:hypothetical protein
MKQPMPKTDSIEELAEFWQAHDLTDFADELEEVEAPAFHPPAQASVRVPLTPEEREAVRRIAASQGVEETTLLRQWVRERLPQAQ